MSAWFIRDRPGKAYVLACSVGMVASTVFVLVLEYGGADGRRAGGDAAAVIGNAACVVECLEGIRHRREGMMPFGSVSRTSASMFAGSGEPCLTCPISTMLWNAQGGEGNGGIRLYQLHTRSLLRRDVFNNILY